MYYKGIFWFNLQNNELIVKKVACDSNGESFECVEYSSKSGKNFNHKVEWLKLPHSITKGKPFNYYPRGRVEIWKGKIKVYLNPLIKTAKVEERIKNEFLLINSKAEVSFIIDNSKHYRCFFSSYNRSDFYE